MTRGALAAFWKVEMFLFRRDADAPGKNERVAPRARRFHYVRLPRVYIWNNELERAKDVMWMAPKAAFIWSKTVKLWYYNSKQLFSMLMSFISVIKAEFSASLLVMCSVTWSFRNHSDLLLKKHFWLLWGLEKYGKKKKQSKEKYVSRLLSRFSFFIIENSEFNK